MENKDISKCDICNKFSYSGLLKLKQELYFNHKKINLVCFSCIREYQIEVGEFWKYQIYPELLDDDFKQERELYFL